MNSDDIANSALLDLDAKACTNQDSENGKPIETEGIKTEEQPLDSADFFEKHAKLLADKMKILFGVQGPPRYNMPHDSDVLIDFKRIVKAAAVRFEAAYEGVDEEADRMVHVVNNFQEDVENRNSKVTDTDISNIFENLNLEGVSTADDDNNDDTNMSMPSIEDVKQSLLSTEIVLPRIKAFLEKFTNYVEQNGEIMPTEDKERYAMQLELYKMIESVYETEKPDGMPGTTEQGSKIVLDVMAKLRDYGEPPKEILDSFEVLLHMTVDNEAEPQCPTI